MKDFIKQSGIADPSDNTKDLLKQYFECTFFLTYLNDLLHFPQGAAMANNQNIIFQKQKFMKKTMK